MLKGLLQHLSLVHTSIYSETPRGTAKSADNRAGQLRAHAAELSETASVFPESQPALCRESAHFSTSYLPPQIVVECPAKTERRVLAW